ncbi:hypothetical protein [Clostridium saccharobutylicum]|uniref:Uncharacterized protein n=1 Tax=Clostridium saccharobutylicum TaxID=169679 RepID=A0A1S8N5K9_CLOSA|nr:hypothetical protein [Clostridium saccharobutylicum]OOM11710.1 hypothetical protein CLOSAC_21370 [Clostridium saccharobutylicum]
MVEKANVKGRINLQNYNKSNTPRYYPHGSSENAGQAHIRLHKATKKSGIRLQGGNSNLTDKELIKAYKKAYSDSELKGILGDLRTPNSKIIIATNVTPKEAMIQLERWEKSERAKIEKNKQNSNGVSNKCKTK